MRGKATFIYGIVGIGDTFVCTNMEIKQFSAKMRAITETIEEVERLVRVANEDTGLLSIDLFGGKRPILLLDQLIHNM